MMNKLLIVLTLSVLTMFSVTKSLAQEEPSRIVIAADQSTSMFVSDHIAIEREAIITALANYVVDCNQIQVDYVAWGSYPLLPVSSNLLNQETVDDYAVAIYHRSKIELGATFHQAAILSSVQLFQSSRAAKKVLVFITDGASTMDANLDLGRTIPADVKVYTISLGPQGVSDFVEKNIQPASGGVHFHANNADELVVSLEAAFAAAKNDLCLS